MARVPFVCPATGQPLRATAQGLLRADGAHYPYLPAAGHAEAGVPNFLDLAFPGAGQTTSLEMYNTEAACSIYRNFLDWLFATFAADEAAFRQAMAARLRLRPGATVLVTGCGLGDDIPAVLDLVGPEGEVHAQDLSPAMVQEASMRWQRDRPDQARQVHFSAGNALQLPYAENSFDAALHFGGINLFDDIGKGIAEMNRVVRPGGRVVVSDEGIGPWLRATEYGRMVVTNNRLWGLEAPLASLPPEAAEVAVTWLLGNCFWLVDFTVGEALPFINPHVPHKGTRGGSMWTRFHGQLEGVAPETQAQVRQAAGKAGLSVHDWLERSIAAQLRAEAKD